MTNTVGTDPFSGIKEVQAIVKAERLNEDIGTNHLAASGDGWLPAIGGYLDVVVGV